MARVEVQLLFNFLDWRGKLALARCNRTLLGDCDSPLAWQDSDGLSAFSSAGVVDLNLAVLYFDQSIKHGAEQAIARAMKGLVVCRGRVRVLLRHSASESCCLRPRIPFEVLQRLLESVPRLPRPTV